jgi:hypothetical protein
MDMIRALLPDTSQVASIMELDQHLAKVAMVSKAEDPQCSATPPPVHIQEFVDVLEGWLEGEELFCFQDPGTQIYSVGCGNMQLVAGDYVLPVEKLSSEDKRTGFVLVFILRKTGWTDDMPSLHMPVFRFVGRGYIFDPTSVLQDDTGGGPLMKYRTVPTDEKAWREFLSSLGRKGSDCWLVLA